jgi:predicted nucleic acid-binding protein
LEKFVLDTNVLIHAIRDASARLELADWQRRMAPHLYQHTVVVSELLVGARDGAAWSRWHERWVAPAERVGRVLVPGYGAWVRASRIVSRLTEAGYMSPGGAKPSFFNDCLLAATSRELGHVIVTYNTADFELIARVEPSLRVAPPFP